MKTIQYNNNIYKQKFIDTKKINCKKCDLQKTAGCKKFGGYCKPINNITPVFKKVKKANKKSNANQLSLF